MTLINMKYYLVSPFSGKNNGITNYVNSACELLTRNGVDAIVINNNESLKPVDLEKKIIDIVGNSPAVVELPDAWGLFHDTQTLFSKHVRLHAPSVLLQRINNTVPNIERFKRESKSIKSAKFISSPSIENIKAYDLDVPSAVSFPNPIPFSYQAHSEKNIDVIFIGRADNVKGIDLFSKILSHLPAHLNILIVGVRPEEFQQYKSSSIKCNLNILGWINNEEKVEYLKRSKVCAITSRFESYSLVAAEAISCNCHVISWNVGGFSECYPDNLLTLINYEDIVSYAATILDKISAPLSNPDEIIKFIDNNNKKYIESVRCIISGKAYNNSLNFNNYEFSPSDENIANVYEHAVQNYLRDGIDVFGFSMMNEHAEEMWGTLIGSVIRDYTFVSRKPLGYNSKFSQKYSISPDKFKVYDWRFDVKRLVHDFNASKKSVVFVFNGNTAAFDTSIKAIKAESAIPMVYSELGWLPQKDHIYFDAFGSNYRSSIRHLSLERLTHKYNYNIGNTIFKFSFDSVLLALQLPGDTTLQIESFPLNLTHQELIALVREAIPKEISLIVRKHPRDKNEYLINDLQNTSFDNNEDASITLGRVDALVAVNSTIILEALSYPINIYTLGYGLFENKNIVFECHEYESQLNEKWINHIEFNIDRRRSFLKFLKSRQFPVTIFHQEKNISNYSKPLYPIVESIMNSSLQTSSTTALIKNQDTTKTQKTKLQRVSTSTKKKLQKLIFTPKKFTQDFVLNNHKKLSYLLKISHKANAWLFSDFVKPLIAKKIIGSELDKSYNHIKQIEKYIPEIAYLYYRTKWIYFGVNKNIVKFAKTICIKQLNAEMKFDMASILCESGNYRDAINLAKSCLDEQPDIFRRKQYLRLATLIFNDKDYLKNLPQDEMIYVSELNNCFYHILKSREKIESDITRNKKNIKTIGNSPNQRGIKKGKEINSSNLVIRFNSYDTSLTRRADIGFKTDIWVKSPSFEEVERKPLTSIKSVIITGTNHLDRSPSAYDFFYDFYKNNIPATNIPQDLYHALSKKISSPPSGGMQVLYWIKELNGRLDISNIHGFSLDKDNALKGPNGEVNQKIKYSHNWEKEINIIKTECLGQV